jgi:anti-sigma factor RsiW
MECRNVVNALSDHLDGLMTGNDAVVIEGHLTSCPSCQTVKLELSEIRTAARDLPLHTPPRALWLRISQALEAELVAEEVATPAAPVRQNWWQSWWARVQSKTFTFNLPQLAGASVAALALIFFSAVSFYRQYNSVLTMRGMQAVAVLPEEAELNRQIETLKTRMVSWQPQRRSDFEQQLGRIETSLQECRRHLQANPNDTVCLAMMHDLCQEKRQLLEDIERLKW